MDLYKNAIGAKIKELRTTKNYSQRELASRAGISYSAVSYYENGRSIDIDILNSICIALGIDMLDFLDEVKKDVISQKKAQKK